MENNRNFKYYYYYSGIFYIKNILSLSNKFNSIQLFAIIRESDRGINLSISFTYDLWTEQSKNMNERWIKSVSVSLLRTARLILIWSVSKKNKTKQNSG